MATSGVIEKSFHNGYRLRIEWSQSKDVANNRSTINCKLYLVSTGSGYKLYSSSRPVNWSIDGSGGSFNAEPVNNNGGQKSYLGSFSRTINHNADGSKSASISASWNFSGYLSGTYYGTITASGTANLDSIPRASQPSVSSSSVNMGSSVTIYTNRASSSFTHTIKYSFGSTSGTIGTGVGASISWTPPLSLANQIPNSTSGTCTITCETYSGSTKIGTKTVSLRLNVPSNVAPSLNDFYIDDYDTSVKELIGAYVQNRSRLRIEIWSSHITQAYGSPIKSYRIEFDGKVWTGWAATTDIITKSGNLSVKVTITDGRGRTATRTKTVNVLPYNPPRISAADVVRVNASGQTDYLGTYARVTLRGTISPLTVGSTQKNRVTWRVFSRERGASSWGTPKRIGEITSGSTINPNISNISGYDITKSYEFMFEFQDIFNTTRAYFVLSSGQVTMSWGKIGVGIGKIWERGILDVGGDMFVDGDILSLGRTVWSSDDSDGEVIFGSNSNGLFIRFPNGIQICYYRYLEPLSTTNNSFGNSGIVYWGNLVKNFPAEFVAHPATAVFTQRLSGGSWGGVRNFSTTHIDMYIMGLDNNTTAHIGYIAIGRWK